jgi:hypothetical protein
LGLALGSVWIGVGRPKVGGVGFVEFLMVARETVYLVNISMALDAFDLGYLMGLAVGEGSFTGDKQQPAFQLRMTEEDPEPIRRVNRLIGGSVYGPYNHSERRYFVLMLRGPALWRATTLFYDHLPNCKKRRLFLEWWRKYQAKLPPLPPELENRSEIMAESGIGA